MVTGAVTACRSADCNCPAIAAGQVVAPLQSQAGRINFRYGTGNTDWWKSVEFAESAFWLHA